MTFFTEFKWAVLHAFSNALAACRFEQGDVLYDNQLAYMETWSEAEKHVSYSLQVKSPMRGSSAESPSSSETMFSANWSSRVVFEFCDHRAKITKTIETTQGRLYELLWHGDINNYLSASLNIPMQASGLLNILASVSPTIEKNVVKDSDVGGIFLLPFDISSQQLKEKRDQLMVCLAPHILDQKIISLKDAGVSDPFSFVPTAQIAAFVISKQSSQNDVSEAIKKSLYKPAKNKISSKEVFKISSHGFLNYF
jgi:hypothetical protein